MTNWLILSVIRVRDYFRLIFFFFFLLNYIFSPRLLCKGLFIFHNHRVYLHYYVSRIYGKVVVKDTGRDAVGGDKCKVPSYTKAYPMIETVFPLSPTRLRAIELHRKMCATSPTFSNGSDQSFCRLENVRVFSHGRLSQIGMGSNF